MYIVTIFLITIFVPSVQLAPPAIRLTLSLNEKYLLQHQQIDIKCELLNPTERTDALQLWHVDFKTGKRTPISRALLASPPEDSPEVFRKIRNKRYEYIRKNHLRIRSLQMEDSAKYECDCPDCEESITKQTRELYVMKLTDPKWIIDSGWPLHENTKTNIKCLIEDFYPYVSHKILRNNQDITNQGKSALSNPNGFPQKFTWEGSITPDADWHNTTLHCNVIAGNSEQPSSKILEVLFSPQFLKCGDKQYVDIDKNQSSIECSYRGNPQPKLTWYRKLDSKPIKPIDIGYTIDTKDEQQGRYKSILTFDRSKLISIPLQTTTPNGQGNISGENFYQQLLNNGFTVKLTVNGIVKATQSITIVRDRNQIRSKYLNNKTINLSYSSILLAFLIILNIIIIQR